MNMSAFEERPLVEHNQDCYEREQESGGCGCFRSDFGYRLWRQHDDDGVGDNDGGEEGWVMNKLRKMKQEASEVIAGPKWKTFVRKMNFRRKQKNRFQYDEHSYALNFNSGANSEDDEDDLDFPLTFSSRFTVPIRHTES